MTGPEETFSRFTDVVDSQQALRDVVGPVFPPSADKVIDHIDEIAAAYIAASRFVILASSDGAGRVELSPKGDPAGFVKILDRNALAIPDRPGNRRLDTLENLLKAPQIALLFLVPGIGETLRVYGEARIVRDRALLDTLAINGRPPLVATVVHVERAMMHCPKCVIRSGIWSSPETPPDLPGIGQAMTAHAKLSGSAEDQERLAKEAGVLDLY